MNNIIMKTMGLLMTIQIMLNMVYGRWNITDFMLTGIITVGLTFKIYIPKVEILKKTLLYENKPKRKDFSIRTKKNEWTKAENHNAEIYTETGKFYRSSRCRRCGRPLIWGDGTYDFDHFDNNPQNNGLNNCYLVCKNCHGRATKVGKQKIRDPLFGYVKGYKTIKYKVGYKKNLRKK